MRARLRNTAAVAAVVVLGMSACQATEEEPGRSGSSRAVAEPEPAVATSPAPSAEPQPASVVTHTLVRKRVDLPFRTRTVRTADLPQGERRVEVPGRTGVRVRVFRTTSVDGVASGREMVKEFVARRPVARVETLGTYVAPPPPPPEPAAGSGCDSNYEGACVPIASDVDCGGGSGNGPEYVDSPVRVVGDDIYDLDADGDGYGCD